MCRCPEAMVHACPRRWAKRDPVGVVPYNMQEAQGEGAQKPASMDTAGSSKEAAAAVLPGKVAQSDGRQVTSQPGAAALAHLTPVAVPTAVQSLLQQCVAFMQQQSSIGSNTLVSARPYFSSEQPSTVQWRCSVGLHRRSAGRLPH